ncbi:MAG: bifunctional folylpolyglutamate synthase/dihydrofolate synthase [Bacteroidetes bacterium]|nr:bifunctional folylpolyglutamate synthase/dihydrofolate synthase [Bacteroidota bacterium]
MDYKETITWLFNQLPMYQRIGKAAYKADLSNTIYILDALGNPEKKIRAIHIAGTNGKGSVSHMIASVLQEAGYSTGLYTSPHLKDFRERIKINGQLIPEDEVIRFVKANKDTFTSIESSFFEMTVGMAFDYFAKQKVDFAVIETGLGGRLDSTNLCHPVISIITNIGIDHTEFLGDSLKKIAIEKAGIIKAGIPVIVGKHDSQVDEVFEQTCSRLKSPLYFAEDDLELREFLSEDDNTLTMDVWYKNNDIITGLKSSLLGNYQKENIRTALRSIELLKENNIIEVSNYQVTVGVENTINNTGFYGRWQKLSNNPVTICDTAHNVDGIKAIVNQLGELTFNHLHFVIGMVKDKDAFGILTLLPNNATYYFCKPDIPRGIDSLELAELGFKAGLNGKSYNSVMQAYHSAKNNAGFNDLVFIGGSTFVVAEVI